MVVNCLVVCDMLLYQGQTLWVRGKVLGGACLFVLVLR